MAKQKQVIADVPALKQLLDDNDEVLALVNLRPLIAAVMRHCGCTLDEIGQVFNTSRQGASNILKQSQKETNGNRGTTQG